MDFEGAVFVISGASKGIGYTLSNILQKYNATVIGLYNSTKIKNSSFETYKCDVSDEKQVERLFKYIENKYHKVDVLINCAALSLDDDIYEKTAKDFSKVLSVNLIGPFIMSKYASRIMDRGVIINVSSTDANDTYNPLCMDYAASKAGLENLTKNMALRFPKLKICAIAPAWVKTDTVMQCDPKYIEEEMAKHGQKELLRKEDVALKIIEMIINNDNYISGDIVRMEENYE